MWRNLSLLMFVVVLGGCAAFVWITSAALPPVVASHFAASGRANGFAPHEIYVRFMLGMIVVVPGLSVIIPRLGINRPNARINLPNGAYWLAPARRQDTIDYLCGHMAVFGMMLALANYRTAFAAIAVGVLLLALWTWAGTRQQAE